MLAAPRGFEPRFTDPKSAVLPLDEGPADGMRTASVRGPGRSGAEDGTRTRDPHLGKVMLYQLSHFRSNVATTDQGGAESQIRTGDTAIFSRVLYQLSYLGERFCCKACGILLWDRGIVKQGLLTDVTGLTSQVC